MVVCLVWIAGCATPPESRPPAAAPAPAARSCPPTPACPVCNACPSCPACPGTAIEPAAPRLQIANWQDLPGWADDDARPAFQAFAESCKVLDKEPRWRRACAEARRANAASSVQARAFFESFFQPYRAINADGTSDGLVTGYYEPLIKGSRRVGARYPYPVYGVPDDLLVIDLSEVNPELRNVRLRGRIDGRRVVPYYSRAELAQRPDALADKVLLWAQDAIELFFLQIQGSGQVELPDGSRVRIGYADQNGHPYRSIGRWLVDQGEMSLDQASLEGIKAWARSHPARLGELLNVNPSYVFFRELPGTSGTPIGALGVALTPGRSIAVDPKIVPLGAPVFLDTTWPQSDRPLRRTVLAQDTGGAIRGAVRADYFWGFGEEAGGQAGRMRQIGRMWVLLPRDTH